jgi:hypothetical protein
MSDFRMKLGNFEAIPEEGSGNFATSIYEDEYDGLLIARCNQNGRYPEHARAILEGLNGKKHGLDQITALTAERDSLKALCDEMAKALEEAKFALFSSDMTIKDRADQSMRLALSSYRKTKEANNG